MTAPINFSAKETFFRRIKSKACVQFRSVLDEQSVWPKNFDQVSTQNESFAHTLKLLPLVNVVSTKKNSIKLLTTGLVLPQLDQWFWRYNFFDSKFYLSSRWQPRQGLHSALFIIKFEQFSHLVLAFFFH